MGQNDSKEIESTVSILQSQKHISHSQAQKFLHDYHTNDQSVKDVKDFENNRLKMFLKYFVNHKYRATQTLLTKRTKTNQSAHNNESNYDQLMGSLCFEAQKIEQKMVRCHQDINSFILYERLQMLEQMIRSTLTEMGINELIMRVKSSEKSIKITFKKSYNLFSVEQDSSDQALSNLLTHKYRFRNVLKSDLIKEKFIQTCQELSSQQFFVEEIITREKRIFLMMSFKEINSITEENQQIFSKISKLSSAIGDFLDQIVQFLQFYTHQQSSDQSQNKNRVPEICWNVLKIHKNYFDFQHYYFVHKLVIENKSLLHLTSNQNSFKLIKSKVQQLFSKKQKSEEICVQVMKSFEQYEKKYIIIKNNLSDYLQRYFRAINEKVLELEFDLNTELKVLVSSGQSEENQFLFDQIREIVEKQAMPTLLDVFKNLDSFKQFYKDSYHQALKNTNNHSIFERGGISLQFSFKNQVLDIIKISITQQALANHSQNQIKMKNHEGVSVSKRKQTNLLNIEFENEKQNISQLSSTINIKISAKSSSPKNISILDLTGNQQVFDHNIDIFDGQLNLLAIPKEIHFSLALKIMENVNFYVANLSENREKFVNFLSILRSGYEEHNNPFHNFMHGVNVMHTTFILTSIKQIKQQMSQFSQFALVFSALCHDVGHTGYNNAFQIATQSTLAETYNDVSPLQNYHIHRTFKILKDSQCNFIESLDNTQKNQFRKLVISNILNTDVKEHFNVMKRFEEKKDKFKKGEIEDEKIVSGMLIHSSDFAGSIKEFSLCYSWSQLVNEEFKNQSLQEFKLNLPLSPVMINLENPLVLAKNQMGFLKFMVQPLYKSIADVFLSENTKRIYERVNENISQWQKVINQLGG